MNGGTFTSVAGCYTESLFYGPLTGPSDLLCFVGAPWPAWALSIFLRSVRVETRRSLFYPQHAMTFSVNAEFYAAQLTLMLPPIQVSDQHAEDASFYRGVANFPVPPTRAVQQRRASRVAQQWCIPDRMGHCFREPPVVSVGYQRCEEPLTTPWTWTFRGQR